MGWGGAIGPGDRATDVSGGGVGPSLAKNSWEEKNNDTMDANDCFANKIYQRHVDREERRRSAAHGGRAKRGATGFGLGIVVMDAWEVCGPVATVGSGCRVIVTCRGVVYVKL